MTNIFTALEEDHREVVDLLRRLCAETDPERRRVLFDEMQESLRTQRAFERAALYPEARKQAPDIGGDEIEDELRTHDAVENLLRAMEKEDPAADTWTRHCRSLLTTLEEDREAGRCGLLHRLHQVIGDHTARMLGDEYEGRWKQ